MNKLFLKQKNPLLNNTDSKLSGIYNIIG